MEVITVDDVTPVDENTESGEDLQLPSKNSELDTLLQNIESIGKEKEVKETPVEKEVPVEKVATEKPVVEPAKVVEEDRGVARLAAREKQFREERDAFEKEKSGYLKLDSFRDSPHKALKALGFDPQMVMKQILFETMDDSNPVKAQLKTQLSEWTTKRDIDALRKQLEDRDIAAKRQAEAASYYKSVEDTVSKYTDTFRDKDNMTLPSLSTIGKKDSAYLKELILDEIISDARYRLSNGDDGDPITHEEAASRLEKKLAKLATFFSTKPEEKQTQKQVVKPKLNPAPPKSSGVKSSAQQMEEMIARAING